MLRSYTNADDTAVIEIEGDVAAAATRLDEELGAWLGAAAIELEGAHIFVPRPFDARVDGRALRGPEYALYEAAVRAAVARLPCRAVRALREEIYVLDWDRMTKTHDARLEEAYASLPGWLGFDGLPRWFGRDEERGPYVHASVEPPGLQVVALLERERFDEWHRGFLAATEDLPFRHLA